MTAAVTATPPPRPESMNSDRDLPLPTVGTVARKRRRQILSTNRANRTETAGEEGPSPRACGVSTEPTGAGAHPSSLPPAKKKKKRNECSSTEKNKKQQLRYDPDVPMTKDQAAAWRREQRRKRNRESAAASRQKQKDRIKELEEEVDEWKTKFDDAMKRLETLEKMSMGRSNVEVKLNDASMAQSENMIQQTVSESKEVTAAVSPCPSPPLSPVLSSKAPLITPDNIRVDPDHERILREQSSVPEMNVDHLIEISRPA